MPLSWMIFCSSLGASGWTSPGRSKLYRSIQVMNSDVLKFTRSDGEYIPAHPLGQGKRKFWRFYKHELDAWLNAQTNEAMAA